MRRFLLVVALVVVGAASVDTLGDTIEPERVTPD
jgi:hypothetical protein